MNFHQYNFNFFIKVKKTYYLVFLKIIILNGISRFEKEKKIIYKSGFKDLK